MSDYKYSKVTAEQGDTLLHLAIKFEALERYITSVVPVGRRRSLAIARLEEAAMWASKATAKPEPVKNEFPGLQTHIGAPWPGVSYSKTLTPNSTGRKAGKTTARAL